MNVVHISRFEHCSILESFHDQSALPDLVDAWVRCDLAGGSRYFSANPGASPTPFVCPDRIPLRALVSVFPAAAVCLYLRRQTGQKRWLIGTALAALVAAGQTLWAVLEFGQIVPGDYQGLAVLISGSLSGPVPFMGLTIMGCISRLQHPVTRWIGFATLAMVAIVGVSLKKTTDVDDVSFGIFLITLTLSFGLAVSGLLASAVLGTRKVAA
ncbi:MAG: hypothetical protein R3D34_15670 [Nitratireductor sp.]